MVPFNQNSSVQLFCLSFDLLLKVTDNSMKKHDENGTTEDDEDMNLKFETDEPFCDEESVVKQVDKAYKGLN